MNGGDKYRDILAHPRVWVESAPGSNRFYLVEEKYKTTSVVFCLATLSKRSATHSPFVLRAARRNYNCLLSVLASRPGPYGVSFGLGPEDNEELTTFDANHPDGNFFVFHHGVSAAQIARDELGLAEDSSDEEEPVNQGILSVSEESASEQGSDSESGSESDDSDLYYKIKEMARAKRSAEEGEREESAAKRRK